MCGCRGPHAVHSGTSLADNHSSLSGVSNAELDGRSALGSVTFWRACSWTAGQVRSTQVRSTKEEHMMSQSRGAVSFEPLFTAEDIGLRKEANVEHVMKVFITLGEGVA